MQISRRTLLAAAGTMAVATQLRSPSIAHAQAATLTQPPLAYAPDALAPTISEKTVALHFGKHHKTYYEKLNALTPGTAYEGLDLAAIVGRAGLKPEDSKIFNNAAQAWNHDLYWEQFTPGGPNRPQGVVGQMITESFGDHDAFVDRAVATADEVFGTGWVWLTRNDGGKLAWVAYEDANTPAAYQKPSYLGIDVWEHAYYLDYQNRKPDHMRALLGNLVNWGIVGERIAQG